MDHHYSINATIDPGTQTLRAAVKLDFYVAEEQKQLRFLLHREIAVTDIYAPGLLSYAATGPATFPFTPEAQIWQLDFAQQLTVGEFVDIRFSYKAILPEPLCRPWGVNRLTPEWTELSCYAPWYPWSPESGDFTYDVQIFTDPSLSLAASGGAHKTYPGSWRIFSDEPRGDIAVLGAPDLQALTVKVSNCELNIYFTGKTEDADVKTVSEQSLRTLSFLAAWLEEEPAERRIDLVMAPRTTGGGYARPEFIVLSHPEEGVRGDPGRQLRFIAHEMSHLWWTGARTDTWEDWLNESFAEYSSLCVYRADTDANKFAELIADRRTKIAGLPPIRGLDRKSRQAYETLYLKGSLLLLDLEQTIGVDTMQALLRARLAEDIHSTDRWLQLVSESVSPEVAQKFDDTLRC